MRIIGPDDEETGKFPVGDRACSFGCMFLATMLHGVGSGLVGVFIAHLIRTVQIVGFGHDHGGFLEIALESNPWRRMACVIGGGLIGSAAWFWLRGRHIYLVTVEESLKGARMPPVATLMNAMVQDIVVALGGSFGREAAPREIAAMWGGWVGDAFRVSPEQRKILVACGAGAGLAAVYSVPISGALYTIEHVLNWDVSLAAVVPAIVTSVVATLVTSTTVETHGLYSMPRFSYGWPTWDVCLWALLVGPVAGLGAACFRRFIKFVEGYKPLGRVQVDFQSVKEGDEVWLSRNDKDGFICRVKFRIVRVENSADGIARVKVRTTAADEEYGEEEDMTEEDWDEEHAEGQRDWTIFVFMPLAFLVLALLSRTYPSLLGNGRALAEIAMQRQRSTPFLGMLLLLKALMTAAAIGSGAAGGTLTPSVALGATLGAILGESYQQYLPDWAPAEDQDSRMSVVAAAAFLAVAMNSPVTGLWLLMEFSAQGVGLEDLIAVVQGDTHGVIASKMALGMLVPMALGVLCATWSVKMAGFIWNRWAPPETGATDKDYKPIARLTVSSETELALAEMTTQSSFNGGEPEESKLDKLEQGKSNDSVLSLSHDSDLMKPTTKVGRKTLRSTSTSVDLDLPELHMSNGTRNYRDRRNRSVSVDSSSLMGTFMSFRYSTNLDGPLRRESTSGVPGVPPMSHLGV